LQPSRKNTIRTGAILREPVTIDTLRGLNQLASECSTVAGILPCVQ
jgi:hypothetical protein